MAQIRICTYSLLATLNTINTIKQAIVLITGGMQDGFMKPKLVAQLYNFYVNYKRVVTDEKYKILFVDINTPGCHLSNLKQKKCFKGGYRIFCSATLL